MRFLNQYRSRLIACLLILLTLLAAPFLVGSRPGRPGQPLPAAPFVDLHCHTAGQQPALSRIENPWDRDVALKQGLGVPSDAWTRAETLLAP